MSAGDEENPFGAPKDEPFGHVAHEKCTHAGNFVCSTSSLGIVSSFSQNTRSLFIIVPSSSMDTEWLGGGETFSGLAIDVPTFVSASILVPLLKYGRGTSFSKVLPIRLSHANLTEAAGVYGISSTFTAPRLL